jgi:hypothetical protein
MGHIRHDEDNRTLVDDTYVIPPALVEVGEMEGQAVLDEFKQNACNVSHYPVAVNQTLNRDSIEVVP